MAQFTYRLDHAPADNPDDCANMVLDTIAREPRAQIADFAVRRGSKYTTYLDVESSVGYPYCTDTIRCNSKEPRTFTLNTVIA